LQVEHQVNVELPIAPQDHLAHAPGLFALLDNIAVLREYEVERFKAALPSAGSKLPPVGDLCTREVKRFADRQPVIAPAIHLAAAPQSRRGIGVADEHLLASSGHDNTAELWRISDGRLLHTLRGDGIITSLAFTPDGQTLAVGNQDNSIHLWRVSDGAFIQTLRGHEDAVSHVSFSPDGHLLASGSADGTIRLWDIP
jgi:hypothetical protein